MALTKAMECRSIVEVLGTVAFINDHMTEYSTDSPYGFHDPNTIYVSNGDVGTITSTGTLWSSIPDTYSSDSYPYVIARLKSPVGLANFGVKTTSGSIFLHGSTQPSSFVTAYFTVPAGYNYSSLCIIGNNSEFDYVAIGSVPPVTLTPHKITVNRGLSDEESTAELVTSTMDVGDIDLKCSHIKIWLSKDTVTAFNKVFTGRIYRVKKPMVRQEPRDVIIEAIGYVKYLSQRVVRHGQYYEGLTHSVVKEILSTLRDEGLITTLSLIHI